MRSLFVSALVVASLAVGGCGLRPLYANGSKGAVAQVLADVDVAPIEGHSGWLVRNALRDRLQASIDLVIDAGPCPAVPTTVRSSLVSSKRTA